MTGGAARLGRRAVFEVRPAAHESRLFEVVMKSQMRVFCNTWPNSLVCVSFPFSLVRTDSPDLLLAIAVLFSAAPYVGQTHVTCVVRSLSG